MFFLFIKCLLGALTVLVIALLSKSKLFFIAALVPLFPTFSLIAHYIIGVERSAVDLKIIALFGLFSLIPYAAYLIAVYFMSVKYALVTTLFCATMIWFVCAAGLLLFWQKNVSHLA